MFPPRTVSHRLRRTTPYELIWRRTTNTYEVDIPCDPDGSLVLIMEDLILTHAYGFPDLSLSFTLDDPL